MRFDCWQEVTCLVGFLQEPEAQIGAFNASEGSNATLFAGSVAIFTHTNCIDCHNSSIDGQARFQHLIDPLRSLPANAYKAEHTLSQIFGMVIRMHFKEASM